jgi:hypothetical protein
LALFVAIGGTSYAAVSLPANSVGGRQIRNHVIDPVKLNPKYIASSVRAWASVNAQGKIVASSAPAGIVATVGVDRVTWRMKPTPACNPLVTVKNPIGPEGPSSPAFADASIIPAGPERIAVQVSVYVVSAADSLPQRQPYFVAVICPTPAR